MRLTIVASKTGTSQTLDYCTVPNTVVLFTVATNRPPLGYPRIGSIWRVAFLL